MSELSTHLALPYLMPAQAQKHVTHNEALQILDALVQLAVLDRDLTLPPALPEEGARYIVAAGAAGDWLGQAGKIALWADGGWRFFSPLPGWRAEVLDEGISLIWSGTDWEIPAKVPLWGVNATADTTTRLAVGAEASLFTHAGGSHRLKVNKAEAEDTAALLFQTGWSGRAELGLTGSDAFALKVSGDGSAWQTALSVPASGVPDLHLGASIGGKTALHLGNLLGTVSQSGGVPTGAVIEAGSGANGAWTRWADGTQICRHSLTLSSLALSTAYMGGFRASAWTGWTYPQPFAAAPALSGAALAGSAFGLAFGTVSASSAEVSPLSLASSSAANRSLSLLAVGRWF